MTTTLIYGYDPICGWCYGAAPAIRRAAEIVPVRIVMAGLVTGHRAGPAAAMEGYVRHASERLRAVTGRAPSEAFYDWMRGPGAVAASGPPAVAVHAVMRLAPEAALPFAHALTEAHYEEGLDTNDPGAYAPLLARHAPGVALPDIHDEDLADAAFAEGRAMGIDAFPTLILERDGAAERLPAIYDPDALAAELAGRMG